MIRKICPIKFFIEIVKVNNDEIFKIYNFWNSTTLFTSF